MGKNKILFVIVTSMFLKSFLWAGDDRVLTEILDLIDSKREEHRLNLRVEGGEIATFRSREELAPLLADAMSQARSEGIDPTSLNWIREVVGYAMYDIDRPLNKFNVPAADAPSTILTGKLSLEKSPYTSSFEFKREAEFKPSARVEELIKEFRESAPIRQALQARDEAESRIDSSNSRNHPNLNEVRRSWVINNDFINKKKIEIAEALVRDAVLRGYNPQEVVSELIGIRSTNPIVTDDMFGDGSPYRSSWTMVREMAAGVQNPDRIGESSSDKPSGSGNGHGTSCRSKLSSDIT
ncbi:MAG: hypothetical protein R3A80_07080 [Bdellovibrionota bacterium]